MSALAVFLIFIAAGGSFALGYFVNHLIKVKKGRNVEQEVENIREMARREAETIKKEAELQSKDAMLKLRMDFEQDSKQRREEL